jgi:adenylate cyclase
MADVAGYSRLIDADDEGTFAQLNAHHCERIEPNIKEHSGRIVRTTGDGLLVLFASTVDALRCAVEIQRGMADWNATVPPGKRIEFRMGISVGDIIEGASIHGDGVNVAARLEALAEVGGICVSDRVLEDVHGSLDTHGVTFDDAGQQRLKNIARPVRVYRVRLAQTAEAVQVLAVPNRPSIAVLPFNNMSGDPEQEYFADGMVEEITTALSRIHWLFVIARNSSFTYKGRAVDVKQVGRELGVRYVLEGSVRKAANRVRISGQLIDALTGMHLWADRFDGDLANIFDLQDQITASVVGSIAPKLEHAEIERAKRKPTENLDAYDHFLRGMRSIYQWTKEGNSEAIRLFYRAIEVDPDFASAYAMTAFCYVVRKMNGWVVDHHRERAETDRLARRAAELGNDDAIALCEAGYARAYVLKDLDAGAALIDRALMINPNLAWAWLSSGIVRTWLGEPEIAVEHIAHAMRLSPFDPMMPGMLAGTALAHFLAGRYDDASSWAEKALHRRPNFPSASRTAAASHALAGRVEKAKEVMARLRESDPDLRLFNLKDRVTLRRPEDFDRYAEGLRKAGLLE